MTVFGGFFPPATQQFVCLKSTGLMRPQTPFSDLRGQVYEYPVFDELSSESGDVTVMTTDTPAMTTDTPAMTTESAAGVFSLLISPT